MARRPGFLPEPASMQSVDSALADAGLAGTHGMKHLISDVRNGNTIGSGSSEDHDVSPDVLRALAAAASAVAFHSKAAQPSGAVSDRRLEDAVTLMAEQYPMHPSVLGYAATAAFRSSGRVSVAVKALTL